jgi:hypothetical protein
MPPQERRVGASKGQATFLSKAKTTKPAVQIHVFFSDQAKLSAVSNRYFFE